MTPITQSALVYAIETGTLREYQEQRGIDWRDDPDYGEPRETDGEDGGDE